MTHYSNKEQIFESIKEDSIDLNRNTKSLLKAMIQNKPSERNKIDDLTHLMVNKIDRITEAGCENIEDVSSGNMLVNITAN